MRQKRKTEFLEGQRVTYVPWHAKEVEDHPDRERGIVTNIGEHFIFVRFGNDKHSKACLTIDLEIE